MFRLELNGKSRDGFSGMRIAMVLLLLFMLFGSTVVYASNEGDQFLDGIGETALVVRYLFNGDAEDWTRNSLHAEIVGSEFSFVDDEKFGEVLGLLGGEDGSYVRLPSEALAGLESVSVVGWVYVNDLTPWQRFFDFGRGTSSYFYCTPIGQERDSGCRARIAEHGYGSEKGPAASRVKTKRWVHLAVVLDSSKKVLSLYVDGSLVGASEDVGCSLLDILGQGDGSGNHLYLGKSFFDGDRRFGGKLYDVRLYRIALSARQVAVIRHNAISDEELVYVEDDVAGDGKSEELSGARQLVEGLVGVKDVEVRTVVGQLPKLPYYVRGIYEDGVDGGDVRIIWPSPRDNALVKEPGSYSVTGYVPGTNIKAKASVVVDERKVAEVISSQGISAFKLGDVTLDKDRQGRDTPFIKNRDKFVVGLAKTDPDSFLYNFRDAFGQKQPDGVKPLHVWDSQTCRLRGHASGHYLTAIAQAYASTTYDKELHENFGRKMDYMIDVLYDLSRMSGRAVSGDGEFNADPVSVPVGRGKDGYDSDLSRDGIRTDYWNWGVGFISGYPPDQFIMLENGASYGGGNNQVWAPYYTLHKILVGLMDCYEVGGNVKALDVARDMGLWVYKRLSVVPEEMRIKMWNRYIAGEYGGMNEAMARLYLITDDRRFLECAKLFDNIDFFFGNAGLEHGLACNVDTIRGKHANQHIPQITGALETFKGSGNVRYYNVVENFWDICVHSYMYCIGGVAGAKNPNNAECFTAEPDTLFKNGLSEGGQNETCATYNLLKLARQMFMFSEDASYMDYYEQALYNHILASVDEKSPGNTYHVPLNPGARKSFGNANMDGFTCCNGTALESSTKLQDSIYFKKNDGSGLYVNLYIASTLKWSDRGVVVKQQTDMPYADSSSITIMGGGDFSIFLRVPKWAEKGFDVVINGEAMDVEAVRGKYLEIKRKWEDGDRIDVRMPMTFHLCGVMDRPNIVSVFYGPVLLAVQEIGSRSTWRKITLDADDLGSSFKGEPRTLTFEVDGVVLKPFYETYGYHSVYVDAVMK